MKRQQLPNSMWVKLKSKGFSFLGQVIGSDAPLIIDNKALSIDSFLPIRVTDQRNVCS